ncbi:hypothetical protein ILYODFUR_017078 [Ilyodon furcidens]|uniref:Uncharacterized protein n=1 Tax=Ilyodon furcidens TaxID=33524 RepID=A0ABV0UA96_9TELE
MIGQYAVEAWGIKSYQNCEFLPMFRGRGQGTKMAFVPKVKKCYNFSKKTPNQTKVGMKEDLRVPDHPMGSYHYIIETTPPENRSHFFTGKGHYLAVYTQSASNRVR